MAIPTFVAAGTKGEGTTSATPGMPAGLTTGDLLIAFCEYSNSGTPTVSAQGGGSWTFIGKVESSTTAATMAAVAVFTDYYNGSQTAPTFASPGNHMCAAIIAVNGARSADESAFGGTGSGFDTSGDANVSIASGFSTTDADCLICAGFAFFDDNPTFGLTWSNSNLASVTRRVNYSTISGNDGTLHVVTGTLATAGAVGTFTNTATGAGESAGYILAIRPPASGTTITGVALSATPSLPAGAVAHTLTGVALAATPSLPTGTVSAGAGGQTVDGVALSATPSLPAGSLGHTVTGVALTATPSLPAGSTSHRLTGVALSATPTLPTGTVNRSLTGVALSATPTLPTGTVTVAGLEVTGVALSATPSLPTGALEHRLTGVALSATPSLPAGTVTLGVNIIGVALTATPYLPPGEAPWTGSAVYDGTGSVTWGTDRITVDSAGSGDFWGTADAGAIVYRPLVGGVDEVHLLSFPTSGHPRLFQLRKSAAADAAMYAILLDGDGSHITTVWRDTDGASASFAGENTGIPRIAGTPLWLRITYSGSTATAYASQDSGATWQQVGTRSVSGLTLAGVTNGGGSIGAVTTVVDRGAGLVHQLAGATLAVAPLLPVGAVAAGGDWHRIDGSRTQDWHRLEGDGGEWHRLEGTHAGDHHRLDDTHAGDWHRLDGSGRGDWHRQE